MDIDSRYPALSSLVRSKEKCTLQQFAETAQAKTSAFLRFADCCELVLSSCAPWAPNSHNYLATLNAFIERLDSEGGTPENNLEEAERWREHILGHSGGSGLGAALLGAGNALRAGSEI